MVRGSLQGALGCTSIKKEYVPRSTLGGGGGKAARSVSEILGVQCGKNKGGGGVWGRGGPGAEERKVRCQTGSGRFGGGVICHLLSQGFSII